MDRTEKAKNIAIAGAAVGVAGGSALVAHKGLQAINTHREQIRQIIREQAAPAVADITEHQVKPALAEIRRAAENMKNATSYTGDIGKIYTGAKGGVKAIFHPSDLARRTKAGFRTGLRVGGAPTDFPVRVGKTVRKIVKGFSAQLNDIIEWGEGEAVGEGIRNALQKISRLNKSAGAGVVVKRKAIMPYTPRLGPRTGIPAKGWSPDRSDMARGLSARAQLNSIIEFGDIPPVRLTHILSKLSHDLRPVSAPKKIITNRSHRIGDEASDEFVKRMRLRLKPIAGPQKETNLRAQLNAIIELKAMDLGRSYGESCVGPGETPTRKYYPTLYVSDRPDEIDLPLSGEAKVKFKLKSKTSRQDEDGKTRHSADIEIHSIDPISDTKRKPIEGDKAKLLSVRARLNEIIQMADPRPRNTLGEFSGGEEVGPTPNQIGTVYKQGAKSVGGLLASGAVAGVGASLGGSAIKSVLEKVRKARAAA